jgi:ankyrin repeat protein
MSDYLVDYPKNVPLVENFGDILLEDSFGINNEDFNKLMHLLFNRQESNRLKKIVKYVGCMHLKNANRMTPLMMAAKMARGEESLKILEYVLMNSNVNDIDAQDVEGRSALMYAVMNVDITSSVEACQLLIKRGANVDLLDDKGCNSIMLYALSYKSGDSISVAKLLINSNVNIFESSTNNKLNAIMIACKRYEFTHDTKLIILLLSVGANINHRDKDGNTSLMQLCMGDLDKNFGLIKLLIDRKAKVDITNNNGQTVYDILFAQRNNKKNEIVEMLLQ